MKLIIKNNASSALATLACQQNLSLSTAPLACTTKTSDLAVLVLKQTEIRTTIY